MEGINPRAGKFLAQVSELLEEDFVLTDVGCGLGFPELWRNFGDRFVYHGIDPNLREIERLQAMERNPRVRYAPGFVGIPSDHAFARLKTPGPPYQTRNPWNRFAVARTVELRSEIYERASNLEKTQENQWSKTELADPAQPIFLRNYWNDFGLNFVDLVKIDVDGPDFEILNSIDQDLQQRTILGLSIEVTYIGSDSETENTFHNVDRFMRRHGYTLFSLTTRMYSRRALPSRYVYNLPMQSLSGQILQGDALYIRDVLDEAIDHPDGIESQSKYLKLAALFATFGLPDCAAELLLTGQQRGVIAADVTPLLDTLISLSPVTELRNATYSEYMALFERDHDLFYTNRVTDPAVRRVSDSGVRRPLPPPSSAAVLHGAKTRVAALLRKAKLAVTNMVR